MRDLHGQPLIWRIGSASDPAVRGTDRARSAMCLAADYAETAGRGADLPTLQHEACLVAARGLGADTVNLLAHDADRQDFLVVAGVGSRSGGNGSTRLAADPEAGAGLAWRTGRPVVSNPSGNEGFARFVIATDRGTLRSIDVLVAEDGVERFGVLEVETRRHRQFDANDVCFLQLLARSLASAARRLRRDAPDPGPAETAEPGLHDVALAELRHRIRNDLQVICAGIAREIRVLSDMSDRAGYDRVSRQVMAIADLYEHLRVDRSEIGVDIGAYLDMLSRKAAAAASTPSRGIVIAVEAQPLRIGCGQAGPLAIAVNELLANATEHAFPDGQTGTISVRLQERSENGGRRVEIDVSDDGCGFGQGRPGGTGLGYVKRFVKAVGGELLRLESPVGTGWRISLPRERIAAPCPMPATAAT